MKINRFISSIIIFILCFIASYKRLITSGCYGMSDGLWMALIFFLIIGLLMILLIQGIYQRVKNKKAINLYPFITFGICIGIIALILFFQSEKFKSKRVISAYGNDKELILRINNRYELLKKQTEMGCIEIGTYKISNDTIYLKEEPRFNVTLYTNEKFLIDKRNNRVIPIQNDTLVEEESLSIQNHYSE